MREDSLRMRKPPNHKKEKGTKKKHKIKGKTRFKMAVNTYLSIIALNVNGLNAAIKRHTVADWIKKKNKKTKNKSLQYTGHKRPTLGQRTHTDGKWG